MASHGGQPGGGPEPIRSYTSSTLGQPEAPGRTPTRCEAPPARVRAAHSQRGVDATHQEAGLTPTPQAAPRGTGNGSGAPCPAPPLAPPPTPQVHSLCVASPAWPRSQVLAGVAETPPHPHPHPGVVSRAREPTGHEATGRTGVEGNTRSAGGQRPHRPGSPQRGCSDLSPRAAGTAAPPGRVGETNGRVGACWPDGAEATQQARARAWGRPRVPTLNLPAAPPSHGSTGTGSLLSLRTKLHPRD